MSITIEHFRDIMDALEIPHILHKEADLFEFIIHETELFKADVKFLFCVSEERDTIQATGILCEEDLDGADDFAAAYRFCNQWHADTLMPKAVVNTEGKFIACEWSWLTNFEFSDAELKSWIENFIGGVKLCIAKAAEAKVYHLDETTTDGDRRGLFSRVAGLLSGGK